MTKLDTKPGDTKPGNFHLPEIIIPKYTTICTHV